MSIILKQQTKYCIMSINYKQNIMNYGFSVQIKSASIPIDFSNHIPQEQIEKLKICKKFKDYIAKMNKSPINMVFYKIQVSCILMFGGNRIGYVTFKVYGQQNKSKFVNNVFLRGHSVSILMFVNQKIVVVEQYRVPAQKTFIQPPAGMIDESGDLISKAVQEIQQQTSIKIRKQNLVFMGSVFQNSDISDQEMNLYYCKFTLDAAKIKQIQQKQHGEVGSQEKIKVKFIDFDIETILNTGNCSFIELAFAYQNFIKGGKIKEDN